MRDEFDEFMEKLCGALRDAWEIEDERWEALRKDVEPKKRSENLGDILCDPQYLGTGIMEKYFDSYVFTSNFLQQLNLQKFRGKQRPNNCPGNIGVFISPIKTTKNKTPCVRHEPDWCFDKIVNTKGSPWMFFELKSMDRAQIYLFADPVKNGQYWTEENDNNLWYYYWTLAKLYLGQAHEVPRYFVFFLCLPDKDVTPDGYQIYDDYCNTRVQYKWKFKQFPWVPPNLYDIYNSPFRFYWPKIKQLCADFLNYHLKTCNCPTPPGNWSPVDYLENFLRYGHCECNSPSRPLRNLQCKCELILIAYNCHKQLIVSRGKDQFDCAKDQVWWI